MEKCARCGRSESEIKLFDGIYVTEPVKICERCSLISNIPIIKRPSVNQLKDSEKPYGVRARLERMAHLDLETKHEKSVLDSIQELEAKPELEQPEDLVFKLVDNFHWIIQTERRRKGLTTGQLAAELGESEGALKLLEKGIVPSKSLNTINAIEQFLKIRLVKKDFLEQVRERNNKDEQAKNIIYRKSPIIENKDSNFIKQVQAKETQDMINQAINEEKNPNIQNLEKSEGYPFSASSFKKSEEKTGIRDILRMNEKIDSDFTKKSKEQVGKEQVDGFGKEDTSKIRRSVYRDRPSNKVPTIYELMKKKEEKDKTSIIGNDIDLAK